MSTTDRKPLDDMTLAELREEYKELSERNMDGSLSALDDEDEWERWHAMWDELRARTDVEQPECPECGARNWGQAAGDPAHCRECGYETHMGDADLEGEIGEAFDRILNGPEEDDA